MTRPVVDRRPERGGHSALSLLGVGTVASVLAHSYVLAPFDDFSWLGPFDGLARGGNQALLMLLGGAGALFMTRSMNASRVGVLRNLAVTLLTLWAAMAAAVVFVVMTRRFDTGMSGAEPQWSDLPRLFLFDWHRHVAANPLGVPRGLGMLWIFSVVGICLVLAGLLLLVLKQRPGWLAGVLTLVAVGGAGWGHRVLLEDGRYRAAVDLGATGSVFFIAAAAAVLAQVKPPADWTARRLTDTGWVCILLSVLATGWFDSGAADTSMRAAMGLGVFLVVVGSAPPRSGSGEVLETALATVGRRWHLVAALLQPCFLLVGGHQPPGELVTFVAAWVLLLGLSVVVPDVLLPVASELVDTWRSRRRRRERQPHPIAARLLPRDQVPVHDHDCDSRATGVATSKDGPRND